MVQLALFAQECSFKGLLPKKPSTIIIKLVKECMLISISFLESKHVVLVPNHSDREKNPISKQIKCIDLNPILLSESSI